MPLIGADRRDQIVALRKESVDRNRSYFPWPFLAAVALRKESVDRNVKLHAAAIRRAVALRKESVDRNAGGLLPVDRPLGRSPQGERG